MKTNYVQIMKMMGNVHCLVIMLHLSRSGHSLEDLVEETGYSATNISYHIKRLRDKGLIEGSRFGHQMSYQMVKDLGVMGFIDDVAGTFKGPSDLVA